MAANLRIQFDEIDRLRYFAVRARIRAQASEMSCGGDYGSATDHEVSIGWHYDEAEKRLVFTCVKHPWWVPESLVASRIRGLMEAL